MTNSDVLNLDVLESNFCAAVESRNAARDAANSAEFQYRATMELCEHAINLNRALKKNRFHEDEKVFSPLFQKLMKMQYDGEKVYRSADAAYELAHETVEKGFYELQEARKAATFNVPGASNELGLKAI